MGCVNSRCCIEQQGSSSPGVSPKLNVEVNELQSSSSDDEVDGIDELTHFSRNRDSELGIARLSRVSAQFLPPDGSRTVHVADGGFELRYSYLSQRGYYPEALDKANQDSFCIHTPFGTDEKDHFFGVFDGHGEFGAQCSQFVKRKLCENLLRDDRFPTNALEALNSAFVLTNTQLHADDLDDSMSGTTAVTVLVRGKKLYVANCGDSRAVIAERRGKELVAVDLSSDQTPFRTDELARVKSCGARVLTLDQIEGLKNPDVQCWGSEEEDDGDPPRLWVPNGMFPGTAFTRSIGDSIAETIGVVATPEISVVELTQNHPFFVVASDGVFEFISSQIVVDMVAKYKDPRDACAAIVAESYRLWLQYETRTDDITVIVVHINGFHTADIHHKHAYGGPTTLHSVTEVTGIESPTPIGWNPRNHRVRHDLSRARLRALESTLENGHIWVPQSKPHRKTWEEEAHIERALNDHFLFRKLTDSQRHVLLESMQRIEVECGDIVVQQGGEGDCFYVVGTGEFEVFASQEGKPEEKESGRVLHHYTAEKFSCFGELALMYNKPLQASVRAVSKGTLWALRREDFRAILMSEFSNLLALKLLRSIDFLSKLSITQLNHIADSLVEVSFSDGQTILNKSECISSLYIIQKGQVKLSYDADLMKSRYACSLLSENFNWTDDYHSNSGELIKEEGSYFGEWTLLGEHIGSLSAIAIGTVVCEVISKEKFDSAVGPFIKLLQEDCTSKDQYLGSPVKPTENVDQNFPKIQIADMEWRTGVFSTDCSEIGLVSCQYSENILSFKRFSKARVKRLGRESQVLKEKDLMKSLDSCVSCVPKVLCTCADQYYVGLLLNTCLTCTLSSIIHTPLDESSVRFCAASVVVSLEQLHQNGILYRGVSPEVLMFNRTGHLQLIDFRFGKRLSSEKTFTICGMADSLAPEIVQGKGHNFSADWWALGTVIYFMMQAEMPFGSWRESELDTFAKISKGQLTLPHTFSMELVDLITKLLEVDPSSRLGSEGAGSVKDHEWFNGVDWDGIQGGSSPVPSEIISRINYYIENHAEDCSLPFISPSSVAGDLNDPEWLEDW